MYVSPTVSIQREAVTIIQQVTPFLFPAAKPILSAWGLALDVAPLLHSSTETNTNGVSNRAILHLPVSSGSEHPRTDSIGGGRRAVRREALVAAGGEVESIRAEGVAIDLTEVVIDQAGAIIGVLKLQDGLGHFAGGRAHFDGAAVVGRGEFFGISARFGREGILWGADCWVLPTDVEVHVEVAVVADIGVAGRSRYDVAVYHDRCAGEWYGGGVSGGGGVDNPGRAGWDRGGGEHQAECGNGGGEMHVYGFGVVLEDQRM